MPPARALTHGRKPVTAHRDARIDISSFRDAVVRFLSLTHGTVGKKATEGLSEKRMFMLPIIASAIRSRPPHPFFLLDPLNV
jgi:hypothetical protein